MALKTYLNKCAKQPATLYNEAIPRPSPEMDNLNKVNHRLLGVCFKKAKRTNGLPRPSLESPLAWDCETTERF
ncbi:hypothetical protein DPMN_116058 [Dreissena polymorpha]|uniref:Uncharacterized protein n=1 Tax=Dreissena polymorpha TaxID=45954 RepID=A0A9D4KP22_DREPO|nr:hypothetical protein DPMN_116058 [Dreissena polymorpha]